MRHLKITPFSHVITASAKKAGYKAPAFDRYMFCLYVALGFCDLWQNCCTSRPVVAGTGENKTCHRCAKYEHSHKAGGPSDSDEQELCELETRDRNIFDCKTNSEEIDDSITVGY